MNCVSGERLSAALAMRRPELWDTNPRLAERIEMRIKDGERAHRQAHGGVAAAARCLAELHPGVYQGAVAECGVVDGVTEGDYEVAYTAAAEYISGLPLRDPPDSATF